MTVAVLEQALVDPRNIVNDHCTRPVNDGDKIFFRQGFVEHGYNDANRISVRSATAPEIQAFLIRKYKYSAEKADEVTQTKLTDGTYRDYFYCYDGHIRKFVSIQLMEEQILPSNFKLKADVYGTMGVDEEIAFSLAKNATNDFAVPLTFLVTLLRCHDYYVAVNSRRREQRLKELSVAEVGRRMVEFMYEGKINRKILDSMIERRRQIIGVGKRLPNSTLEYLRGIVTEDESGLHMAFNLSNLRAIPRNIDEEDCLNLVKRIARYYDDNIPTPKAIQSKYVSEQVVNVRRANEEISKFVELCCFETLPEELRTLADRMKATQLLDNELSENALKIQLFPPLVKACADSVPGGTNRLAIAKKKLENESNEPENRHQRRSSRLSANNASGDESDRMGTIAKETESTPKRATGRSMTQRTANEAETPEDSSPRASPAKRISDMGTELVPVDPRICDEPQTIERLCNELLPIGWNLINSTFEEFTRRDELWDKVQGKVDLVLSGLPREENNEEYIRRLVHHCGLAMKSTGVTHMFCTYLQFSKVYSAAREDGMQMMTYPMLYIDDPSKVKKLTMKQQPQEWGRSAAVFWRSPDKNIKHHYSHENKFPSSSLPGWASCVTNVSGICERLKSASGKDVKIESMTSQVMSHVLNQWCKPGGFCYNPISGGMISGLACRDLGIRYVALEEDGDVFEAAARRLLNAFRRPCDYQGSPKKQKLDSTSPVSSPENGKCCAVGKDLCSFPGKETERKCQHCRKPVHDLCDWAKLFQKESPENRELVAVCSEACYKKAKE